MVGLVLLVGIGSLQVMLDRGKELVWELTDDHPIVDLSLFKSATLPLGICRSVWLMCSTSA